MATQTRISKWANKVSQSMEMPSPTIPQHHSPDHYQPRSRPSYSQPHSQTHSRSNSVSRSHSRELPHYHREQSSYRPRSHSQSSSRPHATRSYTFAQPTHSRTYSYALNRPPPPMPMPLPPPVPYLHPAPRRSRTLPDQPHQVLYHKYDAPRGGPTYVIGAPGVGGVPPQIRMHNAVTPTKRSQQPLLKRLFTSFGPWGFSSTGPSPKSKHPSTRRHHRRSSF
jgi:hypothetical protein